MKWGACEIRRNSLRRVLSEEKKKTAHFTARTPVYPESGDIRSYTSFSYSRTPLFFCGNGVEISTDVYSLGFI